MSDFRTRLLGLAVLGVAMAGASYGQTIACTGVRLNGITAVLRAEGQTELVQDVLGTGCTSTLTTAGNVDLTLSATPETLNAVLEITDTTGDETSLSANYLGVVSGTTITFANVTFPATFTFIVQNVRVNASTAPLNSYVTESAIVEYKSTGSVTGSAIANLYTPLNVGYTQTSLSVALAPAGGPPAITNYFTCLGNPTFGGLPSASFTVNVTEITPGAFKVISAPIASGLASSQAGENGSSPTAGITAQTAGGSTVTVLPNANTATQLTVTLGNIPTVAGTVVYLPFSITETTPGTTPTATNVTTLQLAGFTGPSSTPASIAGAGVVGFIPTSAGTVTAEYVVTAAWITSSLVFPIPVEVTFGPNTTTQQGAMTVAVAYAPAAAPLTGPPTAIPTFALSSNVFNASIISFCQTTLLFPYVTNSTGYETGLAIANTSTDNLNPATKTAPNGTSFGPAVSGSCTLNFYGNAAQPAAVTVPSTGMIGAYSATTTPPQAPIWDDTLTDLITIKDFTGYAIANCNFLDAHGFAFIVDSTGSGSASGPEGYLAVVIPRNTTTSADANIFALGDGN